MPLPPIASPVAISTAPSSATAGCTMLAEGGPEACSHSSVPSAGETLIVREPRSSSTWGTPAIVAKWGEL